MLQMLQKKIYTCSVSPPQPHPQSNMHDTAAAPPPPQPMSHRRVPWVFPTGEQHQQVCDFIERRDGHRASPDNIFLTNGASEAVRLVLRTAIRGPSDGVMVPVPQVCPE